MAGYFNEFKLIVEFYAALQRKTYHQYCDTFDREWPK